MTSSDNSQNHWLGAAKHAAAEAADFITAGATRRADLVWDEKSPLDFVSEIDVGAEHRIHDVLTAEIPEIRIVGEELGPDGDMQTGLVAIVDPLDGTTNFLHGYPAYSVSICIALDGVPQVGVVHDVARGGVFYAVRGGGAWHDNQRLSVSTINAPARSLIGTGFPFKDMSRTDEYVRQFQALMPLVSGMRRAGSAALDLCDVASGRFEAFWELTLSPWDIAAGLLIVREAGGMVTDLAGHDAPIARGAIVASNGVMHAWLLNVLNGGE